MGFVKQISDLRKATDGLSEKPSNAELQRLVEKVGELIAIANMSEVRSPFPPKSEQVISRLAHISDYLLQVQQDLDISKIDSRLAMLGITKRLNVGDARRMLGIIEKNVTEAQVHVDTLIAQLTTLKKILGK